MASNGYPRKSSKRINRVIYTEGQNGIVRLPPSLWKAIYEAALYLEWESVQGLFDHLLQLGFAFRVETTFVEIVEFLEYLRGRYDNQSDS